MTIINIKTDDPKNANLVVKILKVCHEEGITPSYVDLIDNQDKTRLVVDFPKKEK